MLGEVEGKIGGDAHEEDAAIAHGGVTAAAIQGVLNEGLGLDIDANVEEVGSAEGTVDGSAAHRVHAGGTEDTEAEAIVEFAGGLAALLNLPVILVLEVAPADHPLVEVLKNQLGLAHDY